MKTERDKLEEFIGNNRNAFEEEFDSSKGWEAIEKQITPSLKDKKSTRKINWYAAASIALLLTVSWLIVDRISLNDRVNELESLTVDGRSYKEIESYYTQTINTKSQLVKEKASQIDYPIEQDLDELQRNYEALKLQLKDGVAHQKIVDAMIFNLRTQIEVLNAQLEILEEVKNYTQMQNEQQNEKEI
ncbi:hypothetical protein GCM10011506_33490 [Marivirga lumbricoides]|uniref:Anti-sigma factor n=1 Tax=Marivirga lumbricoides TaxID=1046115 RepID=A0A2T4DT16_9BACT|nr:hypothetical protein C9994_05055 [Marivirga lumbricoides]GGC45191.1 hypothetical protein GCM10011506_33490 [Marivirga lumbricoides]